MPGVHGIQQRAAFGPTDLTENDPVGKVAQRRSQQIVEGDGLPVSVGLGLFRNHMWFTEVQLGGVLYNQDAFLLRDRISQSISSLKEALPSEGVKTLLQAFRTKIFLSTADPDTARYASELCGKADKTRITYTVSESSSNANVGLLSGRTSSSKGSVSASKQYQTHKEPLFEEDIFLNHLKKAQAIVLAFDGIGMLPPTYCYLKLDFMPVWMTWFEQEQIRFRRKKVRR